MGSLGYQVYIFLTGKKMGFPLPGRIACAANPGGKRGDVGCAQSCHDWRRSQRWLEMKRWTASWDLLDFKIGSVRASVPSTINPWMEDYSDQPPPTDFADMLEHLFQRASEQSISTFPFSDQKPHSSEALFAFIRLIACLNLLRHSWHHEYYSAKWWNPMRLAKRSSISCQRGRSPGSQQICGPWQTSASCSKLLHFWFSDALEHRRNTGSLRTNMGAANRTIEEHLLTANMVIDKTLLANAKQKVFMNCKPGFIKGFWPCGLEVLVGNLEGTWCLSLFDLVATNCLCKPKRPSCEPWCNSWIRHFSWRAASSQSCFNALVTCLEQMGLKPICVENEGFKQAQPPSTLTILAGLELDILEQTKSHKWAGCLLSMVSMCNRGLKCEVRMPKRQPSLGREPVRQARDTTRCVKRSRLLWKKPHELVHLNHPLLSVCSYIFPIRPTLDSSNLLAQCIAGRPTGPLPQGCQYSIRRTHRSWGRLMM